MPHDREVDRVELEGGVAGAGSAPRRIVVLVLDEPAFVNGAFLLHRLAELWRGWGLEVLISSQPQCVHEDDLVVNHVDLTTTPARYRAALRRAKVGINAQVHDISKRRIGVDLVARSSAECGAVIVKTNGNSAGHPERTAFFHWRRRWLLPRLGYAAWRRLPRTSTSDRMRVPFRC